MSNGIDVVFSTFNGARTLPTMLDALMRLVPPRRPWRLVAVDNGSSDSTSEILAQARDRLPTLDLIKCTIPGKVAGLQAALPHLAGDLVVFTDDDVCPSPTWLRAYEEAAERHADFGLFGGPIKPLPPSPRPFLYDVSEDHHAELFALSIVEDELLDPVGTFFGPNFLIRRGWADVVRELPASLGPAADARGRRRMAMGEDTLLMELLVKRGVLARGVPDGGVDHLIKSELIELGSMLARAERHGRGFALRQLQQAPNAWKRRMGLARSALRALLSERKPVDVVDKATFNARWQRNWWYGVLETAMVPAASFRH